MPGEEVAGSSPAVPPVAQQLQQDAPPSPLPAEEPLSLTEEEKMKAGEDLGSEQPPSQNQQQQSLPDAPTAPAEVAADAEDAEQHDADDDIAAAAGKPSTTHADEPLTTDGDGEPGAGADGGGVADTDAPAGAPVESSSDEASVDVVPAPAAPAAAEEEAPRRGPPPDDGIGMRPEEEEGNPADEGGAARDRSIGEEDEHDQEGGAVSWSWDDDSGA